MIRGVWFAAGIGAGVYATLRARRVAEAFTPDGARDRLSALGVGARMWVEEFQSGAAQAEADLRDRLALAPQGAVPAPSSADRSSHQSLASARPRELHAAPGRTPDDDIASATGTITAPDSPQQEGHHH